MVREQPVTCGRAEQKLATVGHKNVDICSTLLSKCRRKTKLNDQIQTTFTGVRHVGLMKTSSKFISAPVFALSRSKEVLMLEYLTSD